MTRTTKYLSLLVIATLCFSVSYAQRFWDEVIQITGVTMTADSLRAVPNVTVTVKNKDRGTYSGAQGVFSLVCEKGDTLNFSSLGYRSKDFVVPNVEGRYFNVIQLMVQDTFYLPETIIRPIPYGEEFDYAFKYWEIPDDKYEIARKNTNKRTMLYLMATLPRSGRENQAIYQSQQAQQATYYGQQRPIGIFNPLKWNEFFQSWKRGDFRKKY